MITFSQRFYLLLFLLSFVDPSQALTTKIILSERQLYDVELLANGGFAPLTGFMDQKNYNSVVEHMRLNDGTVWPIPIVLDVSESMIKEIDENTIFELQSPDGSVVARMSNLSYWKPDKRKEAQGVYGTDDKEHPGVAYLFDQTHEYYVSGLFEVVSAPLHHDFQEIRKTPRELKEHFRKNGYNTIIAFQTRNPMHRAHQELTFRAALQVGGHLLIHPVVGPTKPGDINYVTRVKCYKKLLKHYPMGSTTLSLLPLAMRMAGPREALWHAIIRKNYGCTHFIVGRDHAGPGKNSAGIPFYEPYASQKLAQEYAQEIGITIVPFQEMIYLPDTDSYQEIDRIPEGTKTLQLSGTQLRALLRTGQPIPSWFSYPEVVGELKKEYPPRHEQGFTLFFTGLSGAGKSTLSKALALRLQAMQDKTVTLLDGDSLRQTFADIGFDLGFSKKDRSLNVRLAGLIADKITKHKGITLCALIAPYETDRLYNRALIQKSGGYIEVYLSTPLFVCQERDVKGLYAKASAGMICNFTGISDSYEIPHNPEITIDTSSMSIDQAVTTIIDYLQNEGYIA